MVGLTLACSTMKEYYYKKVSYHKQIVRQHSCRKSVWPGKEA